MIDITFSLLDANCVRSSKLRAATNAERHAAVESSPLCDAFSGHQV